MEKSIIISGITKTFDEKTALDIAPQSTIEFLCDV